MIYQTSRKHINKSFIFCGGHCARSQPRSGDPSTGRTVGHARLADFPLTSSPLGGFLSPALGGTLGGGDPLAGGVAVRESPEDRRGRQIRDIGAYTAIPMMLVVGPALGYFLGTLIEKKWGHAPWPSAGGAMFGLVAAGRQIWLLVTRDGRGR